MSRPAGSDGVISVCIVNNMPDAVLEATERQWRGLIGAAAGHHQVALAFFSLPNPRRAAPAQKYISAHYQDIDDLWDRRYDGLIVTGAEPRTASLRDEPFWPALSRLVDWAAEQTRSSIWLCLAAHAAVLHLDGIERRTLSRKIFGLFDCARVMDDKLLSDCPAVWTTPHSRHNHLVDSDLIAKDYTIMSRSTTAGADIFAKQSPGPSRFLFMQGHLEYAVDSLLEEYRREIARFRAGKRADYPDLPTDYLDATTEQVLLAERDQVITGGDVASIKGLKVAFSLQRQLVWQSTASRIYANWLWDLARTPAC